MVQVAIITSPGHNTEIETYREFHRVGLDVKIFKWNDSPDEILKAESFVIPGGFSYEDRVRSGLISAQNPIMLKVKEQVLNGKPLIGICNGAQAVVEMALIPGDDADTKAIALSKNKRVRNGEVLGTGYYNTYVYIKRVVPQNRTPFTHLVSDQPILVPVAHGEGRYQTVYPELPELLINNEQIVFQYCDQYGNIDPEFPINPNGAMLNAASICNVTGNVLSIMPHPERGLIAPLTQMFASLKHHLETKPTLHSFPKYKLEPIPATLTSYETTNQELIIKETITDNEAYTLENTLRKVTGDNSIQVKRYTHYEIGTNSTDLSTIHASGELYNSNKEEVVRLGELTVNDFVILVRYREDFEGQSKKEKLSRHYGFKLQSLTKGTLYHFKNISAETVDFILKTGILYNPNSQIAYEYL